MFIFSWFHRKCGRKNGYDKLNDINERKNKVRNYERQKHIEHKRLLDYDYSFSTYSDK